MFTYHYSVLSGTQDITQLQEWRENCAHLTKSLDNAKEKLQDLGKHRDSDKVEKQRELFEVRNVTCTEIT